MLGFTVTNVLQLKSLLGKGIPINPFNLTYLRDHINQLQNAGLGPAVILMPAHMSLGDYAVSDVVMTPTEIVKQFGLVGKVYDIPVFSDKELPKEHQFINQVYLFAGFAPYEMLFDSIPPELVSEQKPDAVEVKYPPENLLVVGEPGGVVQVTEVPPNFWKSSIASFKERIRAIISAEARTQIGEALTYFNLNNEKQTFNVEPFVERVVSEIGQEVDIAAIEATLPPSLAVIPNIPWESQTLEQLQLEHAYWLQQEEKASGLASANFAYKCRTGIQKWIDRRQAEIQADSPNPT